MKDKLTFKNGTFRIMQIADIQETPWVSPDSIKLMELALDREKPDLVLFTGDQIYGLLPFFRIGDPLKNVERVLRQILRPITDRGIPFAVTFGNHDRESGVPNAAQAELYYRFPGCIRPDCRGEDDKGTFLLTVESETGEKKLNLLVFDSNGQNRTGAYEPVSKAQLVWFCGVRDRQKEELGTFLPTLAFQHIPVPEYYNVLLKKKRRSPGAVEAFRTHKNEFYSLPDELRDAGGFLGEAPASPDVNSGEFELLRESGVSALFVGHDHNNSFVAEYRGVTLAYTQCAGFHVYGPHRQRGVRMIVIDETAPSSFHTYTVTFDELTKDPLSAPLLEFALTHTPTSMEQIKRLAAVGLGAAAAGVCAAAVIRRVKR